MIVGITSEAYGDILGIIDAVKRVHGNVEVSGFGAGYVTKEGPIITDIILPNQECTAGNTEINNDDLDRIILESDKWKEQDKQIFLWWHLHPGSMQAYQSMTDVDTIMKDFGGGFAKWLVAMTINANQETYCTVSSFEGIFPITAEANLEILYNFGKAYESLVKEKISKKVFQVGKIPEYLLKGKRTKNKPFLLPECNTCCWADDDDCVGSCWFFSNDELITTAITN